MLRESRAGEPQLFQIAICNGNVTFSLLSLGFSCPRNVRSLFWKAYWPGRVAGAAFFPEVRFRNRYEINENVL